MRRDDIKIEMKFTIFFISIVHVYVCDRLIGYSNPFGSEHFDRGTFFTIDFSSLYVACLFVCK